MTHDRPLPLVAGNWKMNGVAASLDVIDALAAGLSIGLRERVELLVCPPATLIAAFRENAGRGGVSLGGQDCHAEPKGAFTGDVSAEMLADAGARYVIVGHSERRALHGESDADVRAKALAAKRAELVAIVCVGETQAERASGRALEVVAGQLRGSVPDGAGGDHTVVAYEPVWAIGTGLTPSAADVAEMHAAMRHELGRLIGADEAARVRLLYGGSVKPSNARELLTVDDVDGALVGGASLVAGDLLAIARAYERVPS